ncbi:MAG TPA: hypothetical protein VFU73_10070 [Actinocrinis sp.]|nr:hypothetical protein [Actinocrinis sp.]
MEADVVTSTMPMTSAAAPNLGGRLTLSWRKIPLAATGILACFALLLAQSFTSSVNSDTASNALQGWDVLHGNLLLHNWYAGDAPFYTLETPLYALVEMIMGLNATTMHVVSALTYTLVVVAALCLTKRGLQNREAYARVAVALALLMVPLCSGDLAGLLLETPNHFGTSVYLMLAFLIYSRGVGRRGPAQPRAEAALFVLLLLGQIGDATVRYVALPAILLVTLVQILSTRRFSRSETRLAIAAAASLPAADLVRSGMRTLGAYSMVPPDSHIAPPSTWLNHLAATGQALLRLFHLQVAAPNQVTPGWVAEQIFGAAALFAAVYALCRTARAWRRVDAVDHLLLAAILIYPATYAASTMVSPGVHGAFEFAGVIPMSAVLTARNLPAPPPARYPLITRLSALTATGLLLSGAFKPADVTLSERLAPWLKAHGLHYGIAGYWDAASTTAASGTAVNVRAVVSTPAGYAAYAWVTNGSWYDPTKYDANFVIADNTSPGIAVADVEKVYGKPDAVYPVFGREIVVYHDNLLTKVYRPPHPNN